LARYYFGSKHRWRSVLPKNLLPHPQSTPQAPLDPSITTTTRP